MDTGKHVRELESVSLYNKIRKKWAERVSGIIEQQFDRRLQGQRSEYGMDHQNHKKKRRFEEKVKSFLIEKFQMARETRLLEKDDKLCYLQTYSESRAEN